jgi:Flp pilus assembly protein TadG
MRTREEASMTRSVSRPRRDAGAVGILTAILVPTFLVFCAIAIDVGNWYVTAQQVQKAADAAALAGVTKMPNDYPGASTTALAMSSTNGYPNAGINSVATFQTGRNSELGVTVTTTVNNVFGSIFGNPTTTIARTAIADYQGPAIMGSPCNTFGNEPDSTSVTPPAGTSIPTTTNGGYATCQSRTPNFWATIEGPQTDKVQGDRYSTIDCSSSTDGCSGTNSQGGNNTEYNANGYFFVIRVGEAAKNQNLTVQLYDPAFVYSNNDCSSLSSITGTNNMNPFVPTGASTRYAASAGAFCPGDYFPGGGSSAMVTSYVMRSAVNSQNPLDAPVISGCVKQYGAQTSAPTTTQLTSSSGSYRAHLAEVFHQWDDLCTFVPQTAGDYYLQVRTSASTTGATVQSGGGTNPLIYTGGANASSTSVTQTTGEGDNSFGIRAFVGSASAQPNSVNASVSVAGWERMPMYQNVASGSTFNLLQVKPDAAGKSFYFDLFDVGDGSTGTVTVKAPLESGIADTALTGCQYTTSLSDTTPSNANLNGLCRFSTSGQNGKVLELTVPIPAGYNCGQGMTGGSDNPGACWFRVTVNWSGSPTDITTWNATIGGDALRLVQ